MSKVTLEQADIDVILAAADRIRAQLLITPTPVVPVVPVAEEPEETFGERPKLCWGSKVSSTFRERVWWIAEELAKKQGAPFDANWLMGVMAWESGEKFSASVKNMAGSGATGLIQFMPTTAVDLGKYRKTTLTTAMLAKMTAEDQLTWVYWYFHMMITAHGAITNLEDCYMAVLWPAAIGSPVTSALWTKTGRPTTYRQNSGLDANSDGTITKLEAADKVRAKLTKGLALAT